MTLIQSVEAWFLSRSSDYLTAKIAEEVFDFVVKANGASIRLECGEQKAGWKIVGEIVETQILMKEGILYNSYIFQCNFYTQYST